MKKLVAIFVLFLIGFLASCNGDTTPVKVDCLTNPNHEECSSVEVDCLVTPNHIDCEEPVVDCLVTPNHIDCVVEEDIILTCEEQGINSCRYTVSKALSDGTFEHFDKYKYLSEAEQIMEEDNDPDLVVLYIERYVVSMKYGAVNFKTKTISETTTLAQVGFRYPTYINGNYNVDGIFLKTDGIITYGMIAGVKFEVLTNEIELIPHVQAHNGYSYYTNESGELVHKIAYVITDNSHQTIGPIDIAPDYLMEGTRYYSYDNHYFYTDIITMTDDLTNGVWEHALNADTPYYNYYQYVSFRSKTNYTADELNSYINSKVSSSSGLYNKGQDFINAQEDVFINGAMEMTFAIHESGWGNSAIAKDKNNFFGINAYDSDPYNSATTFDTAEECIEYHASYTLGARYFNPNFFVGYGTNFGNKQQGMNYKYASDAFWGEKIAKHYYNLDKALGFKDRNSYQIAFLDINTIGYFGESTDSPIVYDSSEYNYYGLEIPFVIMRQTDDFYVLQLPLGLNNDMEMDIDEIMNINDVFFILKEDATIIN